MSNTIMTPVCVTYIKKPLNVKMLSLLSLYVYFCLLLLFKQIHEKNYSSAIQRAIFSFAHNPLWAWPISDSGLFLLK